MPTAAKAKHMEYVYVNFHFHSLTYSLYVSSTYCKSLKIYINFYGFEWGIRAAQHPVNIKIVHTEKIFTEDERRKFMTMNFKDIVAAE